jgi:hyperosmotically inducible periplasmic protein
MNKNILKASLLATAIALGFGAATVSANDGIDRTNEQVLTDAAITASLKTKLLADPRTEGFDINVETVNGVVHLTGGADTAADKAAATELANTVDGVVLIKNDLVVAADGTQARTNANDATLSGQVRDEVEDATDGIDEEGNNVVNNAGEDTDTDGDGAADANLIESDADVDGDANVATPPPGGDAWITNKVKAQLLADAAVEGHRIDVDTVDQVVTLSGTAESAAARAKAIELAAATGGVKKVIADDLVVAD